MKGFLLENIRSIKEQIRTVKGKILLAFLMLASVVGIFIGYQYVLAVLFVSLLVFIIKQAEKENTQVVAPWQHQAKVEKVQTLEKKAKIIREHIKKHDEDLDAKLKLAELEEEIKQVKSQYIEIEKK